MLQNVKQKMQNRFSAEIQGSGGHIENKLEYEKIKTF